MMVSATSSEADTVKRTEMGSDRVNLPAPPGRKSSGRKARISTAVQPTTASDICEVAAIAAS